MGACENNSKGVVQRVAARSDSGNDPSGSYRTFPKPPLCMLESRRSGSRVIIDKNDRSLESHHIAVQNNGGQLFLKLSPYEVLSLVANSKFTNFATGTKVSPPSPPLGSLALVVSRRGVACHFPLCRVAGRRRRLERRTCPIRSLSPITG